MNNPIIRLRYIICNGAKVFRLNGELHREDGPALEWSNGYKQWYLNDTQYTHNEWFSKLTPEQQYNYLWNLDE
jgi:hypothetical protein